MTASTPERNVAPRKATRLAPIPPAAPAPGSMATSDPAVPPNDVGEPRQCAIEQCDVGGRTRPSGDRRPPRRPRARSAGCPRLTSTSTETPRTSSARPAVSTRSRASSAPPPGPSSRPPSVEEAHAERLRHPGAGVVRRAAADADQEPRRARAHGGQHQLARAAGGGRDGIAPIRRDQDQAARARHLDHADAARAGRPPGRTPPPPRSPSGAGHLDGPRARRPVRSPGRRGFRRRRRPAGPRRPPRPGLPGASRGRSQPRPRAPSACP